MTASWLDNYGSPAPVRPITPAPRPPRPNPLAPPAVAHTAVARARAQALAELIRRHRDEYRQLLADELAAEGLS